jgi:hypothetical protein
MLNSRVKTMLDSAFLVVMLAAMPGCEDKSAQAPPATKPSSQAAAPASATTTAPASNEAAAKPESKVRDGKWEANSAGRGVAYTVESKGNVVTLNMGGTVFEGSAHEGGRRYKTATNEYLVVPTADGFELRTKDKPTWRVALSADNVIMTADDKKFSSSKVGDVIEIKSGNDVIGKVQTEGPKVKVTDASGAVKWDATDGLVGAWGVLLMTDIGQPMQRLLFTELLARGR